MRAQPAHPKTAARRLLACLGLVRPGVSDARFALSQILAEPEVWRVGAIRRVAAEASGDVSTPAVGTQVLEVFAVRVDTYSGARVGGVPRPATVVAPGIIDLYHRLVGSPVDDVGQGTEAVHRVGGGAVAAGRPNRYPGYAARPVYGLRGGGRAYDRLVPAVLVVTSPSASGDPADMKSAIHARVLRLLAIWRSSSSIRSASRLPAARRSTSSRSLR